MTPALVSRISGKEVIYSTFDEDIDFAGESRSVIVSIEKNEKKEAVVFELGYTTPSIWSKHYKIHLIDCKAVSQLFPIWDRLEP